MNAISPLSFLSSPSGIKVMRDLVQRDGIVYRKFFEAPFTGEINNKKRTLIVNVIKLKYVCMIIF
jgi:hypothetical protein